MPDHKAPHPPTTPGLGQPPWVVDLRACFGCKLCIPPEVDRAILARARTRLGTLRARRRRRIRRFATLAVAASVVLVLRLDLGRHFKPAPISRGRPEMRLADPGAAPSSAAPVIGVLFAANGQKNAIPMRTLRAGEQVQTPRARALRLRIWDRHDILIEPETHLAANRNKEGGCTIALAAGQITASVHRAPGEGPFRVVTPQAVITVTGTIFSAAADFDQTRLYVKRGTVTLATHSGIVRQVTAAETYRTDGVTLTEVPAWDAPFHGRLPQAVSDPVSTAMQSPWYRRRFAELVELKEALAAWGVKAAPFELLAVSAELWNLQYPKTPAASCPPFIRRRVGLERAARWYGSTVRWYEAATPTPREASQWAADSLRQGAVVLAFGLPGDEVQRLDRQGVEALASTPTWHYRFLGEQQATVCPLCRIDPPDGPTQSRANLKRQAVEDIKRLLKVDCDSEYEVGLRAVQAWAEAFQARKTLELGDPFLHMLEALASLGPACWQHLEGATTSEPERFEAKATYLRLKQAVTSLFTTSALEEARTPCAEAERRVLAEQLLSAMHALVGRTWD